MTKTRWYELVIDPFYGDEGSLNEAFEVAQERLLAKVEDAGLVSGEVRWEDGRVSCEVEG